MPNDNETKVKFNLWAVLGFLVLLGGIAFAHLLSVQSEDRIHDGVTRLEANYSHIISGISEGDWTEGKELIKTTY